MSNTIGKVGWMDLTVDDALGLKDFYSKVVGWKADPVSMGDYCDFNMCVDGVPVSGICHAKGTNAGIPAQWMMYVTVDDIDRCVAEASATGGTVVHTVKTKQDHLSVAFIKDPAGAHFALYQAQ